MKMDRIYKINKMRRKKINPVNLVNPVYFPQEPACRVATPWNYESAPRSNDLWSLKIKCTYPVLVDCGNKQEP